MRKTIAIAAGGSGGHIFPAIATAEYLINEYNIVFFSDKKFHSFIKDHNLLQNKHFKLIILNSPNPKIFKRIRQIIAMREDITMVCKISVGEKIEKAIGFGSRVSFVTLLGCKIKGKDVFLHEQNAVMGLANRISSFFCKKCFLTFENTKMIPRFSQKKCFYTGIPIRNKILSVEKTPNKVFTIFVVGGSQGAKIFVEVAKELTKLKKELDFQVIQQARETDVLEVQNIYAKNYIVAEVSSFFSNIDEILSKTDLVISRAGASMTFEILSTGIPLLLIPMRLSANNHQYENAKFLHEKKLATMLCENEISKMLEIILKIKTTNTVKFDNTKYFFEKAIIT